MKVIVKTLNGKQMPLEIESEWTVGKIKDEMEAQHSLKRETLKLIAYGKVLDKDDVTAASLSLKEGDFLVAMVQKPKPAPKAKPAEEVKAEEPVAQAQPVQAQPAATTTDTAADLGVQNQHAAQTQPAQAQPVVPQELPAEAEAAITELIAISGKDRDLCIRALTAAQFIPDVAFEFLMSGHIPEMPAGGLPGADGDEVMDEDYGDEGGAGGEGALANYNLNPETMQAIKTLMDNPSFPMIRQRMVQDPAFAQTFMAQLQSTQPQVFEAIQQNPGLLMGLILGHDPMSAMGGAAGGQPGAAGMGGMGAGAAGGQPRPGTIAVKPEEMDAINRLASLGFPKHRCAEAYFACDKNEEFAANFLFEAGADDEDTAMQNAMLASQNPVAEVIAEQAQPEQPAAEQQNNNAEEPNQNADADAQNQNQNNEGDNNNEGGNNNNEGGDNADGGNADAGAGGSSLL